jgi:hypothetical protein
MSLTLNPIVTGTPGQPPSYNVGMAETFSWVPVENNADRPLFARAGYITNLKDLSISLSASDINIGGVELTDGVNNNIRATIVPLGGSNGNALKVLTQNLKASSDNITIGDIKGNLATVDPTLSALNVNVTNPITAKVDPNFGFPITFADSPNLDAFGKLRVSTPYTLFDSKTLHNKSSLFWSQAVVGTGAINFTGSNDASVTLSATANGDAAIRQTSQRFNYQPGKSQLAIFTGILNPVSNAVKRYGLFTSLTATPFEPNLGLYFETQTDSTSSIAVVQNNGTNLVPSVSALRQNWNIDKLDGNGPSGKVLRLSAANIFLVDFEWLGVGRVRFGTVIDGQVCYCHEINNAGSVQGAYLKSPNLPVRAEIRQTSTGSASMKMICSSVMSEGGSDFTGVTRSVDTGGSSTGIPISTGGNRRAIIGVRLQAAKLDSVNEVLNASVIPIPQSASTSAPYRYEIVSNPTLGGTAVTWNDVDASSNFQYAVAPNNTVSVTGGTVIASGYSTLGQTIDLTGYRFEKFLRVGCTVDGVRDRLWLVVTPIADSTINGFHGSLTFIESD